LGRDIAIRLVKEFLPYILAFLLGLIVAWQGCNSKAKTITKVVERPVPTIEYVDRWRTDTVRFVSKKVITQRDTIYQDRIVNRLDTLFLIDTVSIVEAWLTELVKYDTAVTLNGVNVALKWQNYQNLSEQLSITVKENVVGAKFALGLHANVGIISDFNRSYTPLMGIGIQTTIKSTYISANYGYNGQHFIGVGVGRNLISK
jgi:PBP1b-binding outer membrane lipoprotein LpoB